MAEPGSVRRPTLSRSRHDRAALRRKDHEWLSAAWPTSRVLQISAAGTAPADLNGLRWGDPHDVGPGVERFFLGELDAVAYFAVAADPESDWRSLRDAGAELDELQAGLFTAALALIEWHASHTHCPRCGSPTIVIDAGWARRCPVDESQHFPRTDPAVIMLVHDGADRCVLGRQARWPHGRYSILAGFVEAGESAEAAVAREVYEEVGLRVTDIAYRSSQPWPFPASLMLGFTARAEGDLTIVRHDDELAAAGWFTRAQVAAASTWPAEASGALDDARGALHAIPGGVSIARFMLDEWLDEV